MPPPTAVSLLIDALPLLVVAVALISRRVTPLGAGALGLAVAAVAAAAGGRSVSWLATEGARGAWLAWHAIAVIAAGMVLHRALRAREQAQSQGFAGAASSTVGAATHAGARHSSPREAVFSACFIAGPFMESVTGFGVGAIIALGLLLRLGLPRVEAAALSLFSQVLVPWGALAVGSRIGAEIGGFSLQALGEASAQLMAFVMPALLLPFWWLLARAGVESSGPERLADVVRIAVLVALVWGCNRYIGVELAGALPTGLMLVAAWLPAQVRAPNPRRALLGAAREQWPYLLLVAGLMGSRLIPGLEDAAGRYAVLDPFSGFAPLAVLRHPSSWLMLTALAVMLVCKPSRAALGEGLVAAWIPMLATLAYVELAQLFSASGGAASLGAAWNGIAGAVAPVASPVLGAVAGALTGSNTASNALMLPVQAGIAVAGGVSPLLLAAINNVAGSICTLMTPARIVMVAGVADCRDSQGRVYAAVLPVGIAVVAALLLALVALR